MDFLKQHMPLNMEKTLQYKQIYVFYRNFNTNQMIYVNIQTTVQE